MSAYEVADKLTEAIKSGKYDVIIINFANPDMVGHTGIEGAAIKAVEDFFCPHHISYHYIRHCPFCKALFSYEQ